MSFSGKKFKITIAICCVVLVIILVLVSPLFYIQEVIIQGNSRVGRFVIENKLGIFPTTNILSFNTRNARRRIMTNLYIDNVHFRRDLPGRLYVTVVERRPSAYVEHFGSFLRLDDNGRVLEIRPYTIEPLPLLEGLQFSRFVLGEILDVANATDFDAVVLYTQLLVAHDLIHSISHINVSDPTNIRIFVNYLDFHVGGITDADEKVRTIVQILYALPDAGRIRAFVDMKEIRPQYNLELLQ